MPTGSSPRSRSPGHPGPADGIAEHGTGLSEPGHLVDRGMTVTGALGAGTAAALVAYKDVDGLADRAGGVPAGPTAL